VEIREYEGEDLSAITDFRENSIKGPQDVELASYQLQVTGLADNPASYTYDEVLNGFTNYAKVVELNCVEGWSVKILWEGIQVKDILEQAGAPTRGQSGHLPRLRRLHERLFPIEYITDNNILMAYKMNASLCRRRGAFPFELVRREQVGLQVDQMDHGDRASDDLDYQGFWEQRGYSNSGDLDKGFFDNPTRRLRGDLRAGAEEVRIRRAYFKTAHVDIPSFWVYTIVEQVFFKDGTCGKSRYEKTVR
jgi:DMSO/TMAO reductase YedYZ molybdopterin-dependent catalytic subunit